VVLCIFNIVYNNSLSYKRANFEFVIMWWLSSSFFSFFVFYT